MPSAFTEKNLAVSLDPLMRVTERDLERNKIIYGSFIPVYGERLSYFIAGPPGCGKSTTAALILHIFSLFQGPIPIYLFTDLPEEDRAFKGLPINKMKMDLELLEEIKPEMFARESDCWVIFDDIDKIRDPKVSKALCALMDNIIANGRSHGKHHIHVIVTSHSLSDYRKTKYMIENCEYWVIFPSKTITSQLNRLLSKVDMRADTLKQNDRVFIRQSVPSFIVGDDFISLL